MSNSDAFALRRSGLNEFLFAPVGTETNGMTLSLVSVFARLGKDPWQEAGRLTRLPRSEATESLARLIAGMPTSIWPLSAATEIAARLIALLPTQSGESGRISSAPAFGAKAGRFVSIAMLIVCIACVLVFETGIFRISDAPKPGRGDVAGFSVPPG